MKNKKVNTRDYFQLIESSNKRIFPINKVWISRIDARESKLVKNLLDNTPESFTNNLCYVAKKISNKFPNCIIYIESDEINIIFIDNLRISNSISKPELSKLNSYIGQLVFYEFNNNYDKLTFFDVKSFFIPPQRVLSYLQYRFIYAENFAINYYASKMNYSQRKNKKNEFMKEKLKDLGLDWDSLPSHNKIGSIYINGKLFKFDRNNLKESFSDVFDIEDNILSPLQDDFSF